MKQIEDRDQLDKYSIKYGIDRLVQSDIMQHMKLFKFEKNDYLCQQDTPMPYFYFFLEGKVAVYSYLANGKRLLLCFYDSFQVIGDIQLIEETLATTHIQAVEDSYCIGVPFSEMRRLVREDAAFLRFVCVTLAEKLSRCSNNSSINLLYPLENRLASYIQATSFKNIKGNVMFHGNLSEIADLLGTSYRHLLRTLEKFCHMGYLTKRIKGYQVIQIEKIKELGTEVYL